MPPADVLDLDRAVLPGWDGREGACVRLGVAAMGTRFELLLGGEDPIRLRGAGEAAIDEILRWHAMLSCFDKGSEIARVNEAAAQSPVRVGPELMRLLLACQRAWEDSHGAFDISVGPLLHAWGLREPPLSLDEARARTGMHQVELDATAGTVRFARQGVRLDLGGVGKGAALDSVALLLREAGVTRAFVHGGTSSVLAIGTPPDQPAWRVRLPSPPGLDLPPMDVDLRNVSLSVSAPSGRLSRDGRAHVIDPRRGGPVEGSHAACVVAPSGVEAEIGSTAMLVLGYRPRLSPTCRTFMAGPAAWKVEGEDDADLGST
ncbi:MAG: FAD:protein FMN transferase [Phycisphaerales bacterium]|nr:FAD:protein FMN transferase [Phycisphaerales bacterium]